MIFYIKTLILIAIICVCGYIGYLKSIKYQNRLEEQKAFFNLIQTIKSKIEFTATPIQEILNEYQAPKSLQNFIKIVLQNLAEQQTLEQSCQNALNQINAFNEFVKIDGIILTKLDGTAKGGVVVAIEKEYHLPVAFVGVGEGVDDLEKFDFNDFIDNLF